MSEFQHGSNHERFIVDVELSDKTIIGIELEETIEDQRVSYSKISMQDVMQKLESLARDVGDSVKRISDAASPDEVSIEMGLEASLETGKLSAILVQGGSKAHFKVTLKWNLDK
jgi:hypothetical protein